MKQTKQTTYAELKEELDDVLAQLQSDDLDIDNAVTLYARGAELVKQLEVYLNESQNAITKIKADFTKAPKE